MMVTLSQHWTWNTSSSIPAMAALGLLLTLVVGALRLRRIRERSPQATRDKPLFPRNRVFLVEKSAGAGCARPCATGPLFQFDAAETHESLDFADSARALDQDSGADPITLFVPNFDRSYRQQAAAHDDLFAPLPDTAFQAWKQQQHQHQHQHQHQSLHGGLQFTHNPPPAYFAANQFGTNQAEPDFYVQSKGDDDLSYGYTRTVEFGDDDSDSGASLPSHNIESLELMDAGPMVPGAEGFSAGAAALQQPANPFASVPPVAANGSRQMNGTHDTLMSFDKALEPLDPTFALDTSPRSQVSDTQADERESRKSQFLVDPNNLLYNAGMPLPLANPSYSIESDYVSPHGMGRGAGERRDSAEDLAFSHLSAPDSSSFYFSENNQVGGGRFIDVPGHDLLPVQTTFNQRRKASLSTSPSMKNRRDVLRQPVHIHDGVDSDFAPVPGITRSFGGDPLAGASVPTLGGHSSDGDAPSSVGSSGVSPKSPKETDGSGDDAGARYRCPHCDTSFRIRGYLTRHIKKHADVMMYNCPFFNPDDEHRCHATGGFSRRDTYKTHLKARHFLYPRGTGRKDRARMPGNCSGCGERFSNNEEWIETHIQTGLCTGQSFNSEHAVPRDTSIDSSPTSEQDADIQSENYSVDNGPYHHDFQRQHMLMTHVQ